MRKIKINVFYNIRTRSYEYSVTDKKTKELVTKGYYKTEDRFNKTTGDIAKEIYEKFKDTIFVNCTL